MGRGGPPHWEAGLAPRRHHPQTQGVEMVSLTSPNLGQTAAGSRVIPPVAQVWDGREACRCGQWHTSGRH